MWITSFKSKDIQKEVINLLANEKIEAIITTTSFSSVEHKHDDIQNSLWDSFNVPVYQLLISSSSINEWKKSTVGLNPIDLSIQVVLPEVDGRICTVPIAFKNLCHTDNELSVSVYKTEPYEKHIETNSSDVIAVISNYISSTIFAIDCVIQFVTSSLIALFLLLTIFIISPELSFKIIASIGCIYLFIALYVSRRLDANGKLIANATNGQIRIMQESLGGIRDVILSNKSEFYFTHSYVVECDNKYVSSNFEYGSNFISSIEKQNIFGVQFHPEKSQKNGLRLLNNFCNL